jgi:hypothetical protein
VDSRPIFIKFNFSDYKEFLVLDEESDPQKGLVINVVPTDRVAWGE